MVQFKGESRTSGSAVEVWGNTSVERLKGAPCSYHNQTLVAKVRRIEAWSNDKDWHRALLNLRLASLAKWLASKIGFADRNSPVRFHPKVGSKLSLSVGTKSKGVATR